MFLFLRYTALFASLLACGTVFAQTTLVKTMMYGGLSREYRIYVPASYSAAHAAPLVLNLHGYTSNDWQQELYGDFRPLADTAGFIIVHPNGTPDANNNLYWNAGFSATGVDDAGFLTTLIDTLEAHYNINPRRVYSTGMSNGAIMSYYLACHSNRFAAIASVTGTLTLGGYQQCSPVRPTPIMEIHGTADGTVPYNGSTLFEPIDSMVSYWVRFNHCNPTPTVTNVADINTTDGATAVHYVYTGGLGGTTVEHFKVINGAHTWPGAAINIGVTCEDFSASSEIWRFFNQYRLPTVGIPPVDTGVPLGGYVIAPNPAANYFSILKPTARLTYITVYDIRGSLLLTSSSDTDFQTLDISALSAGMYIIRISEDGGSVYTAKMVKQE